MKIKIYVQKYTWSIILIWFIYSIPKFTKFTIDNKNNYSYLSDNLNI